MTTEETPEQIAATYGYTLDQLYVHMPAGGHRAQPHIELAEEFTQDKIEPQMNAALLGFVNTKGLQPMTKTSYTELR